MKNQSIAMQMVKNASLGALIGIAIGTTLELVFSYLSGTGVYWPGTPYFISQFADMNTAALVARVCYAAFGALSGVCRRVFEIERLSLLAASVIHMLLMGFLFTLFGYILAWPTLEELPTFVAVYAIIYVLAYVKNAYEVARLNRSL